MWGKARYEQVTQTKEGRLCDSVPSKLSTQSIFNRRFARRGPRLPWLDLVGGRGVVVLGWVLQALEYPLDECQQFPWVERLGQI